jgi:hypothetical protein
MADDSKIQEPPSDPNEQSQTGSQAAEERRAERDDANRGNEKTDTSKKGDKSSRYQIAKHELACVVRGTEPRHKRLHGRLMAILGVSLAVDFAVTGVLFFMVVDSFSEKSGPSLWRTLAWTSSQMLVGGSSYPPQTGAGHFFEVLLQGYGVTVIAAIAGAFASYFLSGDKP